MKENFFRNIFYELAKLLTKKDKNAQYCQIIVAKVQNGLIYFSLIFIIP